MGATLCHYLYGSESKEGISPICIKLCPIRDRDKIFLTDKETNLISESWKIFKRNRRYNALEVLTLCIKKSPKFQKDLGIMKEGNKLRNDSHFRLHADSFVSFIDDLVDNMNNQNKIQATATAIAKYHRKTKLPITDFIIYKDNLIDYLLENNMTTKQGSKAWHRYLDRIPGIVRRIQKQPQAQPSKTQSTSRIPKSQSTSRVSKSQSTSRVSKSQSAARLSKSPSSKSNVK
ncbi:hypothetical protein L9F63_005700 [Diploptera punctata]|uniref:Globin domain-containing protein n=1 Tax=Diploptera punctata TaxID=6984 RepID=A0AAD8E5V9_DIPPU|nr:hypothetical protein L9F63_005700 [Diploptera punctata]